MRKPYVQQKRKNIEVFQHTENLVKTNPKLKDALQNSSARQYIIKETDVLETTNTQRFEEPCKIIVSKKRSLEAASAYTGQKVCVHNFASATNPGGGVTRGSNAQEEAICRCSTLYFNISESKVVREFHNYHRQMLKEEKLNVTYNDDCIYTPEVVVFKSDTMVPELLEEDKWYNVDIITCAAPNLRERPNNAMNPGGGSKPIRVTDRELKEIHVKRMRRILDIAKKEQEDVVILGAFGCGAFSNPPRVVAEAMAEVVKEYQYDFLTIEFAVYCVPRDTTNYDEFNRRLGKR
ncbi:TIGR02452 family protein [Anaerosporobacter sp.]|uniref:TIGR02452 family protein n=1 Tax=Anaerosporobacter sp. TaxID=1872529 RepID=UPI00286EFACE|nr:TIGR02452 family protein [Anaerosporobacter sp.]